VVIAGVRSKGHSRAPLIASGAPENAPYGSRGRAPCRSRCRNTGLGRRGTKAPVKVSELEGSDEWSRGAIAPCRVQGQSPGRWFSGARTALERCRRGRASVGSKGKALGQVHGCQTLVWRECKREGEAASLCQAKPLRGGRTRHACEWLASVPK